MSTSKINSQTFYPIIERNRTIAKLTSRLSRQPALITSRIGHLLVARWKSELPWDFFWKLLACQKRKRGSRKLDFAFASCAALAFCVSLKVRALREICATWLALITDTPARLVSMFGFRRKIGQFINSGHVLFIFSTLSFASTVAKRLYIKIIMMKKRSKKTVSASNGFSRSPSHSLSITRALIVSEWTCRSDGILHGSFRLTSQWVCGNQRSVWKIDYRPVISSLFFIQTSSEPQHTVALFRKTIHLAIDWFRLCLVMFYLAATLNLGDKKKASRRPAEC